MNPKVRLIEVDVDTKAYDQGHIPGAVGFNWEKELQDQVVRAPIDKEQSGKPAGDRSEQRTTIVVYGDNNNWFAAWALWIFKCYGHQDVRILDGGRARWLADKREITSEVPEYTATGIMPPGADANIRVFRDQVLKELGSSNLALVDVRSPVSLVANCFSSEPAAGGCAARRSYSWRSQCSLVTGGTRGWHLQVKRRVECAVREQRRHT